MKALAATGPLTWQDKVLDDDNPLRCGSGLFACHSGVPEHQPQVFSTLQQFDLIKLPWSSS